MGSRSFLWHIVGLTLLAGAPCGSAAARTVFDGSWSVLIITEAGNCDRAYRYAVQIEDGVLRYSGDAAVDVAGQVSKGGQVRVTIGVGDRAATGTGRLSRNSGRGTWKGRPSPEQCSGRWEAERR